MGGQGAGVGGAAAPMGGQGAGRVLSSLLLLTSQAYLQKRKENNLLTKTGIITINILLFLKLRDFRILCGKIS
jgi:hypothetical protein